MRRRNAYTLIELCVTMTVGSSLMILTVGLLHQSLSLASIARSRADQHRTFDRLAQDFRDDVHLATTLSSGDPQRLDLTREDGTNVRYESVRDGSDRTQIRREQRSAGKILRQEEYRIDAPVVVTFEALDQPQRAVAQITSESVPIGPQRIPSRQITAVLGRRLAHQRGEVSP